MVSTGFFARHASSIKIIVDSRILGYVVVVVTKSRKNSVEAVCEFTNQKRTLI